MSNFENEKIIAAIVLCVLTIIATGFLADIVVPPKELETDAVTLDITESNNK